MVHDGHQVMVFVHARKETVKTALALREAALVAGTLDEFSCEDHPRYQFFRREISDSRNKEMKQLFDSGFGIHHAGMLRSDRNMMEKMFGEKAIKVRRNRPQRMMTLTVFLGSMLYCNPGLGCQFTCARRYAGS